MRAVDSVDRRPFVIFGLPRSRTFWLSRFLNYGGWTCGHEQILHVRSLDDVKAWLSLPMTGTVETAAAPFWRTLQAIAPEARVVVVRRPVQDVVRSLLKHPAMQIDIPLLWQQIIRDIAKLNRKLDQIAARWPNALSVNYADLATEATCAEVFEHCLPFRHDPAWWASMAPLNLQIDLAAMARQMTAYRPQLDKAVSMIHQQTLTKLRLRPVVPPAGMTIQSEPFDTAFADAQALIRDHCVAVGESADNGQTKNIPMFRFLEERGALQVITARSNGRMFGYLVTVIAPSLEGLDITAAVHTTFYASPDVPGLGMKLQRAALAGLRDRGVDEVFFRAGPRGAGPRMGALYRRLGAQEDGAMYRLTMPQEA